MALYCPIEGGEYLIDETVRELARRTGSDVVVIDAVQLAGGEWGHFGKGASIMFSQNLCAIDCYCDSCKYHQASPKSPPFSLFFAGCDSLLSSNYDGRR